MPKLPMLAAGLVLLLLAGCPPPAAAGGGGLTAEECTAANSLLAAGGPESSDVADIEEWMDSVEELSNRVIAITYTDVEEHILSFGCLQSNLRRLFEESYVLTTKGVDAKNNRGNDVKVVGWKDVHGVEGPHGVELKVLVLTAYSALLIKKKGKSPAGVENYKLAAEISVQDIIARHAEMNDNGKANEHGDMYPNTIATALALWTNSRAFLSFPQDVFEEFRVYRGQLQTCSRIVQLLDLDSAAGCEDRVGGKAYKCRAHWELYHAENNICPAHNSGLDCRSLALITYKEMFEFCPALKNDWKVMYDMGRAAAGTAGAGGQPMEGGGPEIAKEAFAAALAAATAKGDKEGMAAMAAQLEMLGGDDGEAAKEEL